MLSCVGERQFRLYLEALQCDEGARHGAPVCEVVEMDAGGRRPWSSMQCKQHHAGPSGEACSNAGLCPVTVTVELESMKASRCYVFVRLGTVDLGCGQCAQYHYHEERESVLFACRAADPLANRDGVWTCAERERQWRCSQYQSCWIW